MTIKSAVDITLQLVLPLTNSTLPEVLEITNFTAEGTAVEYGFVDDNRCNVKYGSDGSAVAFQNPKITKYIEFTIVPMSEIDIKLTKFAFANSSTSVGLILKDRNYFLTVASDDSVFKTVNPNSLASDPDYKTFRLELLNSIVSSLL